MKSLISKIILSALTLAFIVCLSACGASKEKVAYYNAIMTVVNKADSINAKVDALMAGYAAAKSAEGFTAAVAAVTAQEAEITALKATLSAIPAPPFEDNNIKKSTEEWLDILVMSFPVDKALYESFATAAKLLPEIERAQAAGEEISEEIKTAVLNADQVKTANMPISDANDAAVKNARAAILTNMEKFVTMNKLK